jgi:hypothetical protein
MSPRYDKYDGVDGGFRAILAADLTFDAAGSFGPKGVSLDVNGKVVVGTAGQSGGVGLLVKNVPMTPNLGSIAGVVSTGIPLGGRAGEAVDIMTDGEIVDIPSLVAGTRYFVDAAGLLTATAPGAGVNGYQAGWTTDVQGNGLFRLVVRFEKVQG